MKVTHAHATTDGQVKVCAAHLVLVNPSKLLKCKFRFAPQSGPWSISSDLFLWLILRLLFHIWKFMIFSLTLSEFWNDWMENKWSKLRTVEAQHEQYELNFKWYVWAIIILNLIFLTVFFSPQSKIRIFSVCFVSLAPQVYSFLNIWKIQFKYSLQFVQCI